MNQAQRVVIVIALGVVLVVAAVTVSLLLNDPFDGGWYEYAPSTGVSFSDDYFMVANEDTIVRQGLVWLAAVAIWTAASVRLLRTRRAGDADG